MVTFFGGEGYDDPGALQATPKGRNDAFLVDRVGGFEGTVTVQPVQSAAGGPYRGTDPRAHATRLGELRGPRRRRVWARSGWAPKGARPGFDSERHETLPFLDGAATPR